MDQIFVTEEMLVDGSRLDRVLMRCDVVKSARVARSYILNLIKRGSVQVNGESAVKGGHILSIGDLINIITPVVSEDKLKPYGIPLTILFEDRHLLVVDKPAGLTVHPGAGNSNETLLNALIAHKDNDREDDICDPQGPLTEVSFGELERGGIVHRLDKDTSGVLVVAKTAAAHSHLSKQFAERSVGRKYRALVVSTPRSRNSNFSYDEGIIDAPIARHPTQRVKMAVVSDGRRAVTHFVVVERYLWGMMLELRLETGRTHQIRVHCSHKGAPIVGDPIYGGDQILPRSLTIAAQKLGRQALHAATLEFTHPNSGQRLYFESSLPEDFREIVERFRSYRGES